MRHNPSDEAWARFVEQQKELGAQIRDPSNRALAITAVLCSVGSALALSRLYSKLTPDPADNALRVLAQRGLTAVIFGAGYVWWEMMKAAEVTKT